MQSEITTLRLILNKVAEDDHDFVYALVNTEGWLRFIGDRKVHSREDAINYIRKIQGTPNFTYWVVRLKENNVPIGIISFLKRNYLEHWDIGFALLPEYYGCGYAYEATQEVLSIMSKKAEHPTILATTLPQNERSIRLLTKLGLRFEKEIKVEEDTLCVYSNKGREAFSY